MTDVPIRDAPTRDALIALHFQNDICHPEGRIPFSLDRGSSEAQQFLDASKRALGAARHAGWTIVHMHVVFAEDYSDLLRNCRLFQKAEALGALKRGSWGAAPFDGFEPRGGEIFVAGNGNSALLSSSSFVTHTVSSFVFVRNKCPLTPMMSPKSSN